MSHVSIAIIHKLEIMKILINIAMDIMQRYLYKNNYFQNCMFTFKGSHGCYEPMAPHSITVSHGDSQFSK